MRYVHQLWLGLLVVASIGAAGCSFEADVEVRNRTSAPIAGRIADSEFLLQPGEAARKHFRYRSFGLKADLTTARIVYRGSCCLDYDDEEVFGSGEQIIVVQPQTGFLRVRNGGSSGREIEMTGKVNTNQEIVYGSSTWVVQIAPGATMEREIQAGCFEVNLLSGTEAPSSMGLSIDTCDTLELLLNDSESGLAAEVVRGRRCF